MGCTFFSGFNSFSGGALGVNVVWTPYSPLGPFPTCSYSHQPSVAWLTYRLNALSNAGHSFSIARFPEAKITMPSGLALRAASIDRKSFLPREITGRQVASESRNPGSETFKCGGRDIASIISGNSQYQRTNFALRIR